jgi:hypothetical protein
VRTGRAERRPGRADQSTDRGTDAVRADSYIAMSEIPVARTPGLAMAVFNSMPNKRHHGMLAMAVFNSMPNKRHHGM